MYVDKFEFPQETNYSDADSQSLQNETQMDIIPLSVVSTPPATPPPDIDPTMMRGHVHAVNSQTLSKLTNKYVYVRQINGKQFWIWVAFTGRKSAGTWKWTGSEWIYVCMDLGKIANIFYS